MRGTRAWWEYALLKPPDSVAETEGEPGGVTCDPRLRQQPRDVALYAPGVLEKHSLPDSLPSAGQADVSMKKPRCNLLLQRGLQCRGERIRTSDLLNPMPSIANLGVPSTLRKYIPQQPVETRGGKRENPRLGQF
jgi:hypothetical protein